MRVEDEEQEDLAFVHPLGELGPGDALLTGDNGSLMKCIILNEFRMHSFCLERI